MKKELAEKEMAKHINLISKMLVHKTYQAKMKLTELCIEKTPGSRKFYVACKLKGKLGNITETLEYVLANYI